MKAMILTGALMALVLGGAAMAAPALPVGVHVANGALADAAGMPLYTFNYDTMVGMSHCEGDCAKEWPPLVAPPGAKPLPGWTIIEREDGSHQWAYKNKPLYTFMDDQPGKPGAGEANNNWRLAH